MTGSGTEGDPYIIENVTDLQNIQLDLSAYYELGGDIDASATSTWNGGAGFAPISVFTGSLDGKDYAVSSLFINRSTSNVGLFATLNGAATNLGLETCDITGYRSGALASTINGTATQCYTTGQVSSVDDGNYLSYAGGFCYLTGNGSVITDCYSRCSASSRTSGGFVSLALTGSGLTNCYSTGAVTSWDGNSDDSPVSSDVYNAGTWTLYPADGVFYTKLNSDDSDTTYAKAEANDCEVILGVTGISVPVGAEGIWVRVWGKYRNAASGTSTVHPLIRIGGTNYAGDSINKSTTSYSSSGGLFANNPATGTGWTVSDVNTSIQGIGWGVTDSTPNVLFTYMYVTVSYYTPSTSHGFTSYNDGTITASFWDTQTSGHSASAGATGKTTAQMKTESTFTSVGWDFATIWNIDGTGTINNGYPYFGAGSGFIPKVFFL